MPRTIAKAHQSYYHGKGCREQPTRKYELKFQQVTGNLNDVGITY